MLSPDLARHSIVDRPISHSLADGFWFTSSGSKMYMMRFVHAKLFWMVFVFKWEIYWSDTTTSKWFADGVGSSAGLVWRPDFG